MAPKKEKGPKQSEPTRPQQLQRRGRPREPRFGPHCSECGAAADAGPRQGGGRRLRCCRRASQRQPLHAVRIGLSPLVHLLASAVLAASQLTAFLNVYKAACKRYAAPTDKDLLGEVDAKLQDFKALEKASPCLPSALSSLLIEAALLSFVRPVHPHLSLSRPLRVRVRVRVLGCSWPLHA
jgi:hypothetical protein